MYYLLKMKLIEQQVKGCYLAKVEIKDRSIKIDVKNFLDQPINNDIQTSVNINKIYTTGCLLGYPYFKDNYNMIAIDLSKQKALDADSRAIQQISFTGNLDRTRNTTMFFILEEAKETT